MRGQFKGTPHNFSHNRIRKPMILPAQNVSLSQLL
jgi:hypothetical protein